MSGRKWVEMELDVRKRNSLAERILQALREAVPGSISELRGSLRESRADEYSDVDVLWDVPDSSFLESVNNVGRILEAIQPIESLRSDPDFQNSEKRRLIFVQFEHTPLFWRVDIDVFAQSIGRDPNYDVQNESARGDNWSPYHSALMNAVATIKALKRGRTQEASALMARAFDRVDLEAPRLGPPDSIPVLLRAVTEMEPKQRMLAERVTSLHEEELGLDPDDNKAD